MAENKRYIQLTDVVAVRIKCKKCGIVWEGPIETLQKYLSLRQGLDCPAGCGTSWADPENIGQDGRHFMAAKDFVWNLAKFRENMSKQNYSFALEIENSLESRIAATTEEIAQLEKQIAREKQKA